MTSTDLLDRLLGDSPALAALRGRRPELIEQTELAYRALYEAEGAVSAPVLHALAARAAAWAGVGPLYALHAEAAAADDADGLLQDHVDLLTTSPALAGDNDIRLLEEAGVAADTIVLISQLAAFESYLARLVVGLAAIDGTEVETVSAPADALPFSRRQKSNRTLTATGRAKPLNFTRDVLEWEPWVAPVNEDELTEEQRESFASKSTANSPYFRLLARTPAVLHARSAIDNAVFLPRDGLPKAERELAAAVASRVNDCIYCASVHARKSATLSKREADVDRLLQAPLTRAAGWQTASVAPLADEQDDRWAALITAAARLSLLRPEFDSTDVDALEHLGLDHDEITDLVGATAFFAWANRLMLTLGEAAAS